MSVVLFEIKFTEYLPFPLFVLLLQCPHDGRCPLDNTGKYCHFVQRLERTTSQRAYKVLLDLDFVHHVCMCISMVGLTLEEIFEKHVDHVIAFLICQCYIW